LVRTGLCSPWVTGISFVRPGGEEDGPAEPPQRRGVDRRRLRLQHLFRSRAHAKVLADRLGTSRLQLWGGGVPVNVDGGAPDALQLEFGGGRVLSARPTGARRPLSVRLLVEPTTLPLLLS
jgi:hypothetical protein